ncbi:MAG TPA: hypothetical protein VF186_02955 [Gaiellaceae bacterium]
MSNERIAIAARAHRFDEATAVPFICECREDECGELVRLALGRFAEMRSLGRPLLAPGHTPFVPVILRGA